MSTSERDGQSGSDDPFYIGYLPHAPVGVAPFVCQTLAIVGAIALAGAALLAVALPYYGGGKFEYGQPRNFTGTIRCDVAPRLIAGEADYLLVGVGKHGAPLEICGADGREVSVRGTLIQRDGRRLVEVAQLLESRVAAPLSQPRVPLGRFTLTGEIVDSKCYFGVMNPGEGRLHRACAELCLRGGVPAVFVARDRNGNHVHLLIENSRDGGFDDALISRIGGPIELSGEVSRSERWLIIKPDLATVRSIAGQPR
jgi:hypothetical protein